MGIAMPVGYDRRKEPRVEKRPKVAAEKPDPLKPSLTTLIKLGSIAAHADEGTSAADHEFDMVAMRGLLADPEVVEWMAAMDAMAFLPKKRSDRG